ncbi:MAG: MarR family winged helix-turn-helix transcriptional regulator [Pyrinomonadaceae bacterium]
MEFEDTVSFLLAKIAVAHRNLTEKAAKGAGLHSGQAFVLFELWKQDGQRQVDLAAKLSLTPPTVNRILGGLLENDFVTRAHYENDARSTRIFLTDKGVRVRTKLAEQWAVLEERTLGGLTETEALMLRQLLAKLVVDLI